MRQKGANWSARELARRLGAFRKGAAGRNRLRRTSVDQLTIRRRKNGQGFVYSWPNGRTIRDQQTLIRLKRLAVPPAYEDVRLAEDASAHIQAVGRDRAGRRQYRYHPDWERVRERRKARHLSELMRSMPAIRTALSRHLRDRRESREFTLASIIELVSCTALRPGSEGYARQNGTRGAATLLKSEATISGDHVFLRFRGKGEKMIEREVRSKRVARALRRLKALPGRRVFQYRAPDRKVCIARRRDVNAFLRRIGRERISLKDFRTMIACSRALENLAALEPKPNDAGRKRQLKAALCAVSEELANAPAICRKSYVHAVVVDAFEKGLLKKVARRVRNGGAGPDGERMLQLVLNAV